VAGISSVGVGYLLWGARLPGSLLWPCRPPEVGPGKRRVPRFSGSPSFPLDQTPLSNGLPCRFSFDCAKLCASGFCFIPTESPFRWFTTFCNLPCPYVIRERSNVFPPTLVPRLPPVPPCLFLSRISLLVSSFPRLHVSRCPVFFS